MSDVNMAALIAIGGSLVVVVNGLGLAYITYLQHRTATKVSDLTEAVNGPLTASLETVRDQAKTLHGLLGTEESRQKLVNAEAALKTHEEGKRK